MSAVLVGLKARGVRQLRHAEQGGLCSVRAGLYRRWSALQDREKALSYVRASVLNGCRTIHRGKYRRSHIRLEDPGHAESAEAIVMLGEAHREVLPRSGSFQAASARPSCCATTWT